ncbi:RNA pseudouridine synthase [Massilia sp. TN1-12]|uniref:RNA pseudouridine synthase n=1 Tax=Massilia paldalensis TaxID=3377675 RepID=UPI00384AAF7E
MSEQAMTDDAIRLAKRVAETVPCSRGEAERYIAGGWVTVDGDVVEDPATRVLPAQAVALLPGAEPVEPLPVTILLHKPAGIDMDGALALLSEQTLAADGKGTDGKGAPRFLRRHLVKLAPAAPLQAAASGIVVFTQDWRVQRKLVEDGDRIEQEFVAETTDYVSDEALARLQAAIRPNVPIKASRQSEARLRFAGKRIRPGQLEELCAAAGLTLKSLRRLRIGKVALSSLPAGRWRYVKEFEHF